MINSIAIDITNHCNFDCIHCIRDKLSPRAHMAPELLEYVLNEISSIGIKNTSLTGGETALHPDLAAIFGLHVKYGIFFNFVSNGYLFINKILPLLDSKTREYFTGVCFSLDGVTDRTHDMIRAQKGSYQRVIEAISACKKEGLPVSVKSIIYKNNIKELADIAFLCASIGVGNIGFIIPTPTPRLKASGLILSSEEYMEVIRFIKGKIIPAFSIKIGIEGYSDPDFKISFCNPAFGISIDHEGNLIFCCNLSHPLAGDEPDQFGKEFLGNIREIGIEEGVLRHYRLLGWFMEKKINGGQKKSFISTCSDCLKLFGKMEWIKNYASSDNRHY